MDKKRIGLFGAPLSAPRRLDSGEPINGSRRANCDFFSSVYRYGSLDEYHCFIPEQFEPYAMEDPRFIVMPLAHLRQHLLSTTYLAFHHLGPSLKARVIRLRNHDSRNLFPLTTTTHTISYAYMLSKTFAPYCLYPLYGFDAILASSRAVQRTLARYFQQIASCYGQGPDDSGYSYPGRIPVIPLGIDHDTLLDGRVPKAQARAELGFPPEACVLLWFGRISASTKGDLLPLLQALRFLRRSARGRPCVLAVAGGGDDHRGTSLHAGRHRLLESHFSREIADHSLRFFHCPSDLSKARLYSAADVFISLSDTIQESFGLTVIEAQAMGLPAIVSDWDGYRDIVRQGITGFRIPTYWCRDTKIDRLAQYTKIESYHFRQAQSVAVDIPQLLSRLAALIGDDVLRARLGQQAQAHACQYHWRNIIRRYEQLWTELYEESAGLTARHGIEAVRASAEKPSFLSSQPRLLRPRPCYYDMYRHFATAVVDDTWRVELGEFTELLLDAAGRNLSRKILLKILAAMEARRYGGKATRVRDLIDGLLPDNAARRREGPLYDEEIVRHVMWLFKQGVIHCSVERDKDLSGRQQWSAGNAKR